MTDLPKKLVICSCCAAEHNWIWEYDSEYKEVNVKVHLDPYKNVFKRIWYALRYIFGIPLLEGSYAHVLLNSDNIEEVEYFLASAMCDMHGVTRKFERTTI